MTRQSLTHPRGPAKAALYCRVSTTGQTAENQLLALRDFAAARGWTVTEFVDSGVSGAKEKRPALDAMLAAVRSRKVDVVACVKLDCPQRPSPGGHRPGLRGAQR